MSQVIPPVKGMHDILPDHTGHWLRLEQAVRHTVSVYGYREIRIPVLESTELFRRSIGEVTDIVEKEMYTFEDRGRDARKGRSLTLRPEATAGIVRAGITHGLLYNQRQRLWCMGPMFRREQPQKGRSRQFHQVDVEAIGYEGPDIDAELIILAARLWRNLGLDGLRLEINTLGTSASRRAYRERLVAHFSARADELDAESRERLHRNPLRILDSKNPALEPVIRAAPSLAEHLDGESADHFSQLCALLDEAGVEYTVNPRLVRGLDYYTRTVFEWLTDQLGAQGAVCAGGRYDGLVEQLGGNATPAIGWAMGMERLIELQQQASLEPAQVSPHAYLVTVGEEARRAGLKLAELLRDAVPGLRIEAHCGGGGFRAQMRKADRSGADWAIILGEEEVSGGRAGLKPLRLEGEQETLEWEELGARLGRWLAPR